MAPHTVDLEIPSSVPVPKIYKAFCLDFDHIAPKLVPQGFKAIETVEGDGGVGSIKRVTLGDAIPFDGVTHKVDAIDNENFKYSFTVFKGDLLLDLFESITYHIEIVTSADGGSILKHKTVYNCKGDAQPTEDHINFGKEQTIIVFKAIEVYVIANPSAY